MGGEAVRGVVLVVDDFALGARAMMRVLRADFPVVIAETVADGLDAVARTRRLAGPIVDCRLPDGHGATVLRAARARFPEAPLLALTGTTDDRRFVEAAAECEAEYATKPHSIVPFARRVAIHEVLDGHASLALERLASDADLSVRDTRVLAMTASGASTGEIADRLGESIDEAKRRRAELERRLGGADLARVLQARVGPA